MAALPNTNPVHPATPKSWVVAIPATANANRDGTGTITDIVAPGTTGTGISLVGSLKVVGTGTTTAGMIRVFGHDGTSYFLLHELSVAAATPSATVKAAIAGSADGVLTADGYLVLNLPLNGNAGTSGFKNITKIGISTHNAEAFAAHVKGEGDY